MSLSPKPHRHTFDVSFVVPESKPHVRPPFVAGERDSIYVYVFSDKATRPTSEEAAERARDALEMCYGFRNVTIIDTYYCWKD